MISSIILIVFFFILVLFYPAVSLVLSVSACLLKPWAEKRNIKEIKIAEIIDKKTDKLKELLFMISVFFIFFFAAPLAAFYIINIGAIRLISW